MAFAEKVIEGTKYELRPLDPMLVLQHGTKLVSLTAAPAIEKLSQVGTIEFTKASLVSVGASVIGEALKNMAHPDIQAAIYVLFDTAAFDVGQGKMLELKDTWKAHFLGKPKAMSMFLAFAMEAQYGDFLAGWAESLIGGLKKRFASLALQGPPTA